MKKIFFLLFIFILSCDLNVDEENPIIAITHPSNGEWLSIRDTILVTATDNIGIKKVKCSTFLDENEINSIEDTSSPFQFPIELVDFHMDSISINCYAIDDNNNISEEIEIVVIVDNDIFPDNGFNDGDEIFEDDILFLNNIPALDSDNYVTWENINGLNRITKIQYRNIEIDTIPVSIQNLSQLKNLEFIDLNLANLPEAIGSLSNLEELRVQNNLLTEIPPSVGNLIKLNIIDLSDNQISNIPNEFYSLNCSDCNLEILRLQNNLIESIALDSLNLNNSLNVVWLANNKLNNIKIDCSNGLWSNTNDSESPAITLYQNELCAENPSNEYGGYCIEDWLIVQNCD